MVFVFDWLMNMWKGDPACYGLSFPTLGWWTAENETADHECAAQLVYGNLLLTVCGKGAVGKFSRRWLFLQAHHPLVSGESKHCLELLYYLLLYLRENRKVRHCRDCRLCPPDPSKLFLLHCSSSSELINALQKLPELWALLSTFPLVGVLGAWAQAHLQ